MSSPIRLTIDVTTIRRRKGTPPIGIPRVEQQLATFAINCFPGEVAFAAFDRSEKEYQVIGVREVRELIVSIDPAVPLCEEKLAICELAEKERSPVSFLSTAAFLAAGLVWDEDSLEALYAIRRENDFRLYVVSYDCIPIVMPEYSVHGIADRFTKFVLDMAWSDCVYCISDNSLDDLAMYLRAYGAPCPELRRIRLGCDFNSPTPDVRPPRFASLQPGKFVLCVGTVEARKNHRLLFDVWRELYRHNQSSLVPLVIVGGKGWSVNDFLSQISQGPGLLSDYIHHYEGLFDTDLAWLYEHCRFTVYPSLYEGWGLPIAESLARGKLCIHSNTSSMPEAGQGLGEALDPLNTRNWIDRISYYLHSDSALETKESLIRGAYRPNTWEDCFEQVFDEIRSDIGLEPRLTDVELEEIE